MYSVCVWDVCVLCACMSRRHVFYVWGVCMCTMCMHEPEDIFYVCMCGLYVCMLCACMSLETYSMCVCMGCIYAMCMLEPEDMGFWILWTRVAGSCGLLASAGN